jgi:glutamate-1-semialdehyde 2,1-aminomutase
MTAPSGDLRAAANAALRQHGVLKSPGKIYPCLALTEADFEQTETAVAAGVEAVAAQ